MTSDQGPLHDRYRLLSQLGEGGMGSVWLAEDRLLERPVALKELLQHPAATDRAERRIRAMQEARAMARIQHPAIVRIHDVFFYADDPWIVMEYIKGYSLAEIIARNVRLDEQQIARIGLPVLCGLSAAHKANVLHRDVKPANIVVADDNSVFLVDFGIAKIAGDMSLTTKAMVVGTTEFLAPERLSGENPVGPAADLWSLGVTFFYALEGYSPFLRGGEASREATVSAILHDPLPVIKHRGRLANVIVRLLNKDQSQRGNAQELDEDLQSIIDEPVATSPEYGSRPPHPRSQHAADALTGPRLKDARRKVRDVGADAGAALLLAMPDEHAAQVLADYPPRLAGELIQVIAATRPQTAVAVLQTLSASAAGHALDYLNPDTAASLLTAMAPSEAARILRCSNVRTAAVMIMTVPVVVSVQLIKAMQVKRASAVLEYVKPVTVASLLRAVPDDLSAMLLREFNPTFGAQVMRHL
jgi:predicted Ser/Thr protein kinase